MLVFDFFLLDFHTNYVKFANHRMLIMNLFVLTVEELILRGPRSSSFWFPRNLSQSCGWIGKPGTCDTELIKSRDVPWGGVAGGRGKDDRKQNTLAPWVLKPNSWTHNLVEVSGHNLESSQTWGFHIQCLHYKLVSHHFCSRGGGDDCE